MRTITFEIVRLTNLENLSHKKLSLLAALSIAFLGGVLSLLFGFGLWYAITFLIILFVFCYYVISNLLERFVYRKIKLIYKLISSEKASMKIATDLREKTIDEVKDDVVEWAADKKGEISRLQNNESFRKEFLMNLAHELRTPIFLIQGYIATLLDGEINNPEVNMKFLQNASNSADRLSDMVDDLREISHYESHQIRLEKKSFSIQKKINKIYAELKPIADEKGILLSIKKGCEGNFMVWADAVRIEQVLINLIENAIKYGKLNGNVLVGIYKIDNRQVLIEIADDGMGILPEHTPRVFERFFRTDDARTADKQGNGLGLAIVKHIVEAHNQTINCRSQLGEGTTFSFTLDQDND